MYINLRRIELQLRKQARYYTHSLLWLYRELEDDVFAGKTAIDGRERVELVLQRGGIFRIKVPVPRDGNQHISSRPGTTQSHLHLECFRAINGDPSSLAHNLSGVNEILQDLLMYVGQRPAARALLSDTGCPGGFPEHPALGNEHDMTFRKLFLQFPREPGFVQSPRITAL